MSPERCMDLLNATIDHVSSAHNTKETIHELLLIGFTETELINEFNFSKDDVKEASEEFDETINTNS